MKPHLKSSQSIRPTHNPILKPSSPTLNQNSLDTEIPLHHRPGHSLKKLKTLIITNPQPLLTRESQSKYTSSPDFIRTRNSSSRNSIFDRFGTPVSPFHMSPKFMDPKRSTSIDRLETSLSGFGSNPLTRKNSSLSYSGFPYSKVPMSHYTFGNKQQETMQEVEPPFSKGKMFIRTSKLGSRELSRSGYQGYQDAVRTPSTAQSTTVGSSHVFRRRLDVTEESINNMKKLETIGHLRKRPQFKSIAGPPTTTETIDAISENKEESSMRHSGLWTTANFKLKTDPLTKHKLKIRKLQGNSGMMRKSFVVKEMLQANKENLMVCVNPEQESEEIKYCFVSRTIETPELMQKRRGSKSDVEFNMKVAEVRKKLDLGLSFKYLYLLDGSSVFDFQKVSRQENVIVLSRAREMESIERIMENDVVRSFIEYSGKKDLKIYSLSHAKSRMDSICETGQEMDRRYKDVLRVFDEDTNQMDSEQLGRIIKETANGGLRSKKYTEALYRTFHAAKKEDNSWIEKDYRGGGGASEIERKDSVKDAELSRSLVDKVVNMSVETRESGRSKIQSYLEDRRPVMQSKKLDVLKEIGKHYKSIDFMKLDAEEPEEQFKISAMPEDDPTEKKDPEKLKLASKYLELLLKSFKDQKRKKADYFEIKEELEKSYVSQQPKSPRSAAMENFHFNQLEDEEVNKKEQTAKPVRSDKKNFIQVNKRKLNTKKGDIDKLHKTHKELFSDNIPKYLVEKKFSRRELHLVYTLYKSLCEVTSQRYKHYNIEDGIDFETFRNGIYQVFLQSEELAEKIFYTIDYNFSGFLNWEEFLNAMVIIRARTMKDKIDLFIKIADEDQNGNLSKDEIFSLAKICLGKFMQDTGDGFLNDLCEYFTKFIFTSVGMTMNQEIPLESIKQAILSKKDESELLAMFCGADI